MIYFSMLSYSFDQPNHHDIRTSEHCWQYGMYHCFYILGFQYQVRSKDLENVDNCMKKRFDTSKRTYSMDMYYFVVDHDVFHHSIGNRQVMLDLLFRHIQNWDNRYQHRHILTTSEWINCWVLVSHHLILLGNVSLQTAPAWPAGQSHLYPDKPCWTHVPPFWHGFVAHGSAVANQMKRYILFSTIHRTINSSK